MKCDCRRSQVFSLGSETENRYYYRGGVGGLAATYIQAYGDNQAHGRYLPNEVWNATISNDTSRYKWGYMGGIEWSNLITDYVAKLNTTPTLIVFNAAFWPNDNIAHHMGRILSSAKDIMGEYGRVIWKGITPMRGDRLHPSAADLQAKEWSYRFPWLSYQEFYTSSIMDTDYFDERQFSNPKIYHNWNQNVTVEPTIKHRVFILVGGMRTFNQTYQSILEHLVYQVCSPPSCIAHLVLHLSRADNRPDTGGSDPGGDIVVADEGNDVDDYLYSSTNLFPDGFLVIHKVNGYEIGSEEEQVVMDQVESEVNPSLAIRLHMFRRGDPRRYSMWFARWHAWEYTKKLSVQFDFIVFCRPDLLWMMPAPTKSFFDEFTPNRQTQVWVHATYFCETADTFAFLPSYEVANIYFSLSDLVKGGVACLGGPLFNRELVRNRLANENISTVDSDWCAEEDLGWSERILRRKLKSSGLDINHINAVSNGSFL